MTTEQTIKSWLANNPFVFQHRFDQDILTLIERASAKAIQIKISSITQHRIKNHPQGLGQYLNLVIDDHHEVVLCHAGLAFSPSFLNTGPLPDAPAVTCLTDYHNLKGQLSALLQEEDRRREALGLFQILISILDGAKLVGFDVGLEEEELDKWLTEFEKNFGKSHSPE
ncbi:MAG: hypothetical protein H7A33_04230 [Deltaproteobacteria bacterium]|nr:hypothetical protein [Deltaproteobacteria bacterium]